MIIISNIKEHEVAAERALTLALSNLTSNVILTFHADRLVSLATTLPK